MPTVLITGANRGLGLGLARAYLADGWQVVAAVRQSSAELEALRNGSLDIRQLDLCNDDELAALAGNLGDRPIDVLINNAGRQAEPGRQGLGDFDRGSWRAVFDINLFTPMRLAELFLDHLERSGRGRIVTVSSDLGSMALNTFGGFYAYRASKAAVNAITRSMAIDLAGRGIIAIALHPGWVLTDMGGPDAQLTVETSVRGLQQVIDGLRPEDSGKFLSWDGLELPW
ncbi:MAG: SDR family oxidoreductase [Lysobacterales bacterium]|nr:MAG: SDR family oxidoreductase [Xanthomonadales bacterium]